MSFGPHLISERPSLHDLPPGLREAWLSRTLREFALHDWLVFGYTLFLNLAVLRVPPSPQRTTCLVETAGLLGAFLLAVLLVRGQLLRHPFWAPLIYRLGIYGPVQLSYFFLKDILPVVNGTSLDQELYNFDLALFGIEPAMAMDAIVTRGTTEWFAFFYFGYFFLLALHVVPILFLSKRPHVLGEFSFGMVFLFCVGHIGYMLVPGYGPYKAMAHEFQNAFPTGMWLDMVMNAVERGGAQKDIFPSLHTAAPTFVALFSFRHRREIPFRYTWPLVGFAALNIIIATMFLRWHYVIDVIAGLTLATSAALVSQVATRYELARRARECLQLHWPEFFPNSSRVVHEEVPTHVADPVS